MQMPRKPYNFVPDSDVAECVRRIRARESTILLESERLAVTQGAISKWLNGQARRRALGLPYKPRTVPPLNAYPVETVIGAMIDYADGMPVRDAADKWRVATSTLKSWCSGSQLGARRVPQELKDRCKVRAMQNRTDYPPEDVEWAVSMVKSGEMKASEAAREIGCTKQTVWNWIGGRYRANASSEADWN